MTASCSIAGLRRAVAALVLATALATPVDGHAKNCRDLKFDGEAGELRGLMSRLGYPPAETAFLIEGATRRIRFRSERQLNQRGRYCGLQAVRASVLGCVDSGLASTLRGSARPRSESTSEGELG
jgi:hypothetical protein